MTAGEIAKQLMEHYNDTRQWVYFPEMRVGTGYKTYRGNNPEQRIDLWVLNCYPSRKFEQLAFEVKVSRSDFLHEIKNPTKRQAALELSNYYYFATPKGLVKPEEIPPECGLVEIDLDSTKLRWQVKAPWRETKEPSWRFVAQLARTADGGAKVARMKHSLEFYLNKVTRLENLVQDYRNKLREAGLR